MDLFDIAVASKLAGGSGGGDGGDFSTAKLTVSGGVLQTSLPYLIDREEITGIFTLIMGYREGSYDIALWKGSAIIEITDEATVSGDIEDMGGGMYLITGDCTITIS